MALHSFCVGYVSAEPSCCNTLGKCLVAVGTKSAVLLPDVPDCWCWARNLQGVLCLDASQCNVLNARLSTSEVVTVQLWRPRMR